MFMCVSQEDFLDLCDLFPETKNNMLNIAMTRRKKFMYYKNLNSIKYWTQRGKAPMRQPNEKIRKPNLATWVKHELLTGIH